jgi:hypothetical protein
MAMESRMFNGKRMHRIKVDDVLLCCLICGIGLVTQDSSLENKKRRWARPNPPDFPQIGGIRKPLPESQIIQDQKWLVYFIIPFIIVYHPQTIL